MKKIIIIIIAIVIAGLLITILYRKLFGEHAGIEKKALVSFHRGSAGDMMGGTHQTYIDAYDDAHAVISISHADWYYEDPTVTEYLADIAVLQEIREVFLKYHMQNWDNKKFTDMFVADGASYSYGFDFEEDYVNFSSQYYPEKYAEKLDELDAIINRYLKEGERLPGLLLPESTEEENPAAWKPDDGQVTLAVYEYCRGYLHYRFSNGTEEDLELPGGYSLFKEGEDEAAFKEEPGKYGKKVYAHSTQEEIVSLPERLEPGTYRLEAGGLRCSFVIEQKNEG